MSGQTLFFLVKIIVSGLLIAAISTLARHFPKWAALLTALPMITFLSLIWIYLENRDLKLLEDYTKDVLLWTLPGLLFFIAAIFLFRARVSFALSLVLSTLALGVGLFIFEKLKIIK